MDYNKDVVLWIKEHADDIDNAITEKNLVPIYQQLGSKFYNHYLSMFLYERVEINPFEYLPKTANISDPITGNIDGIPQYLFAYSPDLLEIEFPNDLTYIPVGAFQNCCFSTISLPTSLKYIGAYAFDNCSQLSSIVLPKNVTYIGSGAFRQCWGLTELVLNDGLLSIGPYAFQGCSKLNCIELPQSIQHIDKTFILGYWNNKKWLDNITFKVRGLNTKEAKEFILNNKSLCHISIRKQIAGRIV